jgi:uncharacterized membrane protein YcaP (DUF421 family)
VRRASNSGPPTTTPMHTQALLLPAMSIAEKLLRTLVVYFFLLGGLRLAGKRELGQLNAFDLVVLLLIANTVQNAIIGPDDSLTGGLIGATTLLVINWVVVRFLYSHPRLDKIVEGESDCLIRGGEILHENLKRETITLRELELAARRQGFASLDEIDSCRLEVGGALTFVAKRPTEAEEQHRELVSRLDALVAAQARLADRLDAIQGSAGR